MNKILCESMKRVSLHVVLFLQIFVLSAVSMELIEMPCKSLSWGAMLQRVRLDDIMKMYCEAMMWLWFKCYKVVVECTDDGIAA